MQVNSVHYAKVAKWIQNTRLCIPTLPSAYTWLPKVLPSPEPVEGIAETLQVLSCKS